MKRPLRNLRPAGHVDPVALMEALEIFLRAPAADDDAGDDAEGASRTPRGELVDVLDEIVHRLGVPGSVAVDLFRRAAALHSYLIDTQAASGEEAAREAWADAATAAAAAVTPLVTLEDSDGYSREEFEPTAFQAALVIKTN